MNWILGTCIAYMAFLIGEAAWLGWVRRGLPVRIVVTGTRGKSSLTKILVAGIRAVEPATWGKITGDEPLLLLPDGTTQVLGRRGPARLHEQGRILALARRRGARCVVLESMTISPEAMRAEMRLIRPTMVAITNVRDDHRETLGADPGAQRMAYLNALPAGCRWLTRDQDLLELAAGTARCPAPVAATTGSPFPKETGVAGELLETARAVMAELGWTSEAVELAMRSEAESVIRRPYIVPFQDRRVRLLDGFSANDPESLDRLWGEWRRESGDTGPWSVLLATRADRPLRTRQFCRWIAARPDVGTVHVAGSHRAVASRLLRKWGVTVQEWNSGVPVIPVGNVDPSDDSSEADPILVGMGNARGLGLQWRAVAGRVVS